MLDDVGVIGPLLGLGFVGRQPERRKFGPDRPQVGARSGVMDPATAPADSVAIVEYPAVSPPVVVSDVE